MSTDPTENILVAENLLSKEKLFTNLNRAFVDFAIRLNNSINIYVTTSPTMGTSSSKQDYPSSGGSGGIFACCSSSAAEVVDHPQMNMFQTRRIATTRSPNESSDEEQGDDIGADIIENAPLV